MSQGEVITNSSEVLFIYEARLCNPNGDPDDENKPRIDRRTHINLVSDVRLKRFFRNFIAEHYGEHHLWVTTVDGKHVRPEERLEKLDKGKNPEAVLRCIDARLFGALVPIGKGQKARGKSYSYTGPVQFSWGYSLHPVEIVDSSTITSVFKGREETEVKRKSGEEEERKPEAEEEVEAYGTIGKDWRLYYSLIAFYGVINPARARGTKARKSDLEVLDNLLYKSVLIDATTRTKIGHQPHLYLRVEYDDGEFLLGDLRKFIGVEFSKDAPIRSFQDLTLTFGKLTETITGVKDKINKLYVYVSEELEGRYKLYESLERGLGPEKLKRIPYKAVEPSLFQL